MIARYLLQSGISLNQLTIMVEINKLIQLRGQTVNYSPKQNHVRNRKVKAENNGIYSIRASAYTKY